jgi:hypothetical protein
MAEITTYLSILTLTVNGFNFPIKRHHLEKKKDTIWQTGSTRKILQSVVYRRPISLPEMTLAWGGSLEEDLPS